MIISVVIPTCNRSRLVAEAIESVLAQDCHELEIIVIDDGSTDDTPMALRAFDGRIRYIRQDNRGVNAARNAGIAIARGRYLALLDDDDLWLPFKTRLQSAVLDRCNVGFVFSDFYVYRPPDSREKAGLRFWYQGHINWPRVLSHRVDLETLGVPHDFLDRNIDVWTGDLYEASLQDPYVLPSTALIDREKMGDLRFPETDCTCGDWEFFARLSHQHGAAFVDIETALNRSHEDAVRLTRLDSTIQLRRRLDMVRRVWRADTAFVKDNRASVDAEEAKLLLRLAKTQAFQGDRRALLQTLRERWSIGSLGRDWRSVILAVLALMPFGRWCLNKMRSFKRRLGRVA